MCQKRSIPIDYTVTIFNLPVMLFPCKTRYNKRVIKTVRIFKARFFMEFF